MEKYLHHYLDRPFKSTVGQPGSHENIRTQTPKYKRGFQTFHISTPKTFELHNIETFFSDVLNRTSIRERMRR